MIKLPPLFGWPWSLSAYRCPYSEFCSHFFVNCLCFPPRGKQLLLVHSKNAALVIHSPEGDYFFYIYIFLKVLYKKDYFTTFVLYAAYYFVYTFSILAILRAASAVYFAHLYLSCAPSFVNIKQQQGGGHFVFLIKKRILDIKF